LHEYCSVWFEKCNAVLPLSTLVTHSWEGALFQKRNELFETDYLFHNDLEFDKICP
jgi:hypothetical protein